MRVIKYHKESPWNVEEDRLEEESEADPLVVLVLHLPILGTLTLRTGRTHTRVGLGIFQVKGVVTIQATIFTVMDLMLTL